METTDEQPSSRLPTSESVVQQSAIPSSLAETSSGPEAISPQPVVSYFVQLLELDFSREVYDFVLDEISQLLEKLPTQPEYAYHGVLNRILLLETLAQIFVSETEDSFIAGMPPWFNKNVQEQAQQGIISRETIAAALERLWSLTERHSDNRFFLSYTSSSIAMIITEGRRMSSGVTNIERMSARLAKEENEKQALLMENKKLKSQINRLGSAYEKERFKANELFYKLRIEQDQARETEEVLRQRLRDVQKRLNREIVRRIVDQADDC